MKPLFVVGTKGLHLPIVRISRPVDLSNGDW
jgi:hypothetical protein